MNETTHKPIQVGTRISGGPYHQPIGIVTKYEHGSNAFMLSGGMRPVTGYVDIVWPTGENRHIPVQIVTSLPYRVHDDRLGTTQEIAELRAQAAAHKAQETAKKDEEAKAREVLRAKLIAEYPYLVRCGDDCNSLIAACKNIRIQLHRAFPGVKFSVRSERYSGGDSIRVAWTDGPNSAQVDLIIDQYAGGSFDGMTDCYNYGHAVWNDLFGDAKYVSSNRHYSDRMIGDVMHRIARELGGLDREPTVEDYKAGRLWQVKQSGGCDYDREVGRALQKHTYRVAKS